ncbi:hypothetical protein [Atlantibacter sp.]|uniref:hypothetical protein n=1 Tax=Atlantibacter sp. TaxID=1903473 RepID=UPI0028B07681|nr:hypothetical protein [Atlantibacter sp.]
MKKHQHFIRGHIYNFETHEGKTSLVYYSTTRPVAENYVKTVYIPACKIVTRTNGDILFALELKQGERYEILTAKALYDRYAWQWFEPLADNYHQLIYLNTSDEVSEAYKYFTWQDIVNFSEIDRSPLSFSKGMPGDWKASPTGGADYLLVQVGGKPYWADAIGQIPYAVDTYRLFHSVEKTLETARGWADGTPFNEYDNTNTYDNFFVLRGALYASKRFAYTITKNGMTYPAVNVVEQMRAVDSDSLSLPVNENELAKYLVCAR